MSACLPKVLFLQDWSLISAPILAARGTQIGIDDNPVHSCSISINQGDELEQESCRECDDKISVHSRDV